MEDEHVTDEQLREILGFDPEDIASITTATEIQVCAGDWVRMNVGSEPGRWTFRKNPEWDA